MFARCVIIIVIENLYSLNYKNKKIVMQLKTTKLNVNTVTQAPKVYYYSNICSLVPTINHKTRFSCGVNTVMKCVQKTRKSTTHWRCAVRNRKCLCSATVLQTADGFRIGKQSHIHNAQPGLLTAV